MGQKSSDCASTMRGLLDLQGCLGSLFMSVSPESQDPEFPALVLILAADLDFFLGLNLLTKIHVYTHNVVTESVYMIKNFDGR